MYCKFVPYSQPAPCISSGQRVRAKRSRKPSRVAWGMSILNDWILMCTLLLLLFAEFTYELLQILCVELRLLPGHKVTTTRKFGKVHQVDLTRSPFARQGRIVGTMGHSSRNRFTLPKIAATGNAHIFVIGTSG